MRIVQRAQEGFLLVIAAVFADGTVGEQLLIKLVAIFKTRRGHATGRPHRFRRAVRERNVKWPVFAPEETGGRESLQLFALAVIESLANVNERRDGRIQRTERARNDRAKMRRSDRLWRCVAGVPLVLMAGVQNKTEVTRGVRTNERAAVHDCRGLLQALGEFDVVHRGVDARKRAQE